jgi:copper(I)-binding protein
MNTLRVLLAVVLLAVVLLAATFVATPASAADCKPVVTGGWLRLPPVSMPMLAGFGTIRNDCAEAVTIVAASSPAFADVSIHETRIVDGVSRMRAMPELVVAPGTSATLAPGGLHLMLMQPRAELQAGDKVGIDFELKGGGVLRGQFEVRKPGG